MRRWFQVATVVGTVAVVNCAGVALSRAQDTPPAVQNQQDPGRRADADSPPTTVTEERPDRGRQSPTRADRDQGSENINRNDQQRADRANRESSFGANFRADTSDGLVVDRIEQNGVAARAGLRAQDRIISIDGRTFRSSEDFNQYLQSARGRVPIVYQRGDRQYTVDATLNQQGGQGGNAWLGVYLSQAREGAGGARIQQVFPAGPAARAGLWAGDVVVAAEGKPIRSPDELIAFVDTKQPREEATFTVQRGGREVQIAARLAGRDDFAMSPPGVMSPPGNEGYAGRGEYDRRQYASTEDGMDFSSIPEYAMQLEQHRRQAEQIQRLEVLICELRDDVQELRNVMAGNPSRPSGSQQPGESEQQGSTTPSPRREPQSGQPENSP